MTTNFASYEQVLECGCSLKDGRCPRHRRMMEQISFTYYSDEVKGDAIWDLSDGYGEPGFIPEQGYDWSGIRDSSIEAVEAMYGIAIGAL